MTIIVTIQLRQTLITTHTHSLIIHAANATNVNTTINICVAGNLSTEVEGLPSGIIR